MPGLTRTRWGIGGCCRLCSVDLGGASRCPACGTEHAREHRGGPRANSGGSRRNAGRKRAPRLTADEAKALLRELAPDARTPAEVARALGCRPERVREARKVGCTVATAERWREAAEGRAEADAQRAEDLREYERERFADVQRALRQHAAEERAQQRLDADIAERLGWDESGRPNDERWPMARRESYGASVEAFGVADALSTHPHLGLEEG